MNKEERKFVRRMRTDGSMAAVITAIQNIEQTENVNRLEQETR
jgi:carbamoylphosphate synthase small subunit